MNFERQLREWCKTSAGPYLRPFAPNAAWQDAKVFIVGSNPATPLRDEFSSFDVYWEALTERPELFNRVYESKRQDDGSKTTKRLRALLELLEPVNCLVTNVSWIPAPSPDDITNKQWKEGCARLRQLVEHCRPKVLYCHGKYARGFAKSLGAIVDPYEPPESQRVMHDGMLVLAYHHFTGMGVNKKGTRLDWERVLPIFAERIRQYSGITEA